MKDQKTLPPVILAPAGNRVAFLAAVAAGADAVYVGLKEFSARMEAKNFTPKQLRALTRLARHEGRKVYVALNVTLRPDELNRAEAILRELETQVRPDGIIIQDLAFLELARCAGFSGEIHLSTLANVGFPSALKWIKERLGIDKVVLPRELGIDEIKAMAHACPAGLSLEVFVHGALCYGVSGRCYWSSFLGGKSGLRGRCVQPCRRRYTRRGQTRRFFSCQDLSLDVLVKVLREVPEVGTWKIEGRKKGPHYVYHTVKAYRLFRDEGADPAVKKEALAVLALALGRPGTHYNFLPQRPQNPVNAEVQTGSGLLIGRVQGAGKRSFLRSRLALLRGDRLRFGYEDDPAHRTYEVRKHVPAKGRFDLDLWKGKSPPKGTPVFLVDRREAELGDRLARLEREADALPAGDGPTLKTAKRFPRRKREGRKTGSRYAVHELSVHRRPPVRPSPPDLSMGLWVGKETQRALGRLAVPRIWWWLPPVVWPEDEAHLIARLDGLRRKGAVQFVLNAPWQIALFPQTKGLNIWAGPFCNLANPVAVNRLATLGYSGVIVSPELGQADFLTMPGDCAVPLGVVVSGHWPLCISRACCEEMTEESPFESPRRETAWVKQLDGNYWVFPNWKLDLSPKRAALKRAGYRLFVHLAEPIPKTVKLKNRPGLWNWDLGLT